MDEWEEKYSDQHKRKYWKNKATGKTSWTNPNEEKEKSGSSEVKAANSKLDDKTKVAAAAPSESEWEEKYSDQHKRKYWKNKVTGKTSWTDPNVAAASTGATSEQKTEENPTGGQSSSTEMIPDPDWEEKYSEQHKKKYWKNKVTGKSSWTEPPKISKISDASGQQNNAGSTEQSQGQGSMEMVADEDWEEKYSEQHKKKYWKNKKTGKSSWTEPPKVPKASNAATTNEKSNVESAGGEIEMVPDEDWEEKYSDQHKKKYWKNKKTGKSSWTEPPKVAKPKAAAAADGATTGVVNAESAEGEVEMVPDEDWEEKYSEQHKKKYWKNKKTGKSSWTEPPKVAKPKAGSSSNGESKAAIEMISDPDWEEKYSDQHKKKYWKNKKTGKSSWTEPPKIASAAKVVEAAKIEESKTEISDGQSDATEIEMVPDEDWEEKYSDQHKKKYWKNKKTGKSSWTEPPKISRPKKTAGAPSVASQASESSKVSKASKAEKVVVQQSISLFPVVSCFGWILAEGLKWNKCVTLLAPLISKDSSTPVYVLDIVKDPKQMNISTVPETNVTDLTAESSVEMKRILLNSIRKLALSEKEPNLLLITLKDSNCEEKVEASKELQMNNFVLLKFYSVKHALFWVDAIKLRDSSIEVENSVTKDVEIDQSSYLCLLAADKPASICEDLNANVKMIDYLSSILTTSSGQENALVSLIQEKGRALAAMNATTVDAKFITASNKIPLEGLLLVIASHKHEEIGTDCDFDEDMISQTRTTIWVKLDLENTKMHLYDNGPENTATMCVSLARAKLILNSNAFSKGFTFDLKSCVDDEELCEICYRFSFQTSIDYYKWALSFQHCLSSCSSAVSLVDKSANPAEDMFNSSSIFNFWKSDKTKQPLGQSDANSSNAKFKWNQEALDFSLRAVMKLSERNMIRNMMKRLDIKAIDLKGAKFVNVNDRLVIVDCADKAVVKGSVIISINKISAIGMPGRSLRNIISEFPSHLSIEVWLWEFPHEMFSCVLIPLDPASESTTLVTENNATGEATKVLEEAKVDSIVYLEDGKLKLVTRGKTIYEFIISELQLRLVENDKVPLGHANFAIEIRDSRQYYSLRCESLKYGISMCSCLVEALLLHGAVYLDMVTFFENCRQWKDSLLASSSADKKEAVTLSPSKTAKLNTSTVAVKSQRGEILRAAEILSKLLDFVSSTNKFPNVDGIYALNVQLQQASRNIHEELMILFTLEVSKTFLDLNVSFDNSEDDSVEEVKPDEESSSPLNSPNQPTQGTPSRNKSIRRSLSQGAALLRSNSSVNTNSPRVFVPPADSKDRRNAKRNITVLAGSRRASYTVVTTSVPTSNSNAKNQPGSTIPTEVDMQPLIALDESDSKKTLASGESNANQSSAPLTQQENEEAKELTSFDVQQVTDTKLFQTAYFEIDQTCQSEGFAMVDFFRHSPDVLADMTINCSSVTDLYELIKIIIRRIYAAWSSDYFYLEQFFASVFDMYDNALDASFRLTPLSHSAGEGVSIDGVLNLILEEICSRTDVVGYVSYLSDAAISGSNFGRIILSGRNASSVDISSICNYIIEPTCHRLEASISSNHLPGVLKCFLNVLVSCKRKETAMDIFADCFLPRITQKMFAAAAASISSHSTDFHNEDKGGSGIFTRERWQFVEDKYILSENINNLFKICFAQGNSGNHQTHAANLSLSNTALLARSKWLVNKALQSCQRLSQQTSPPSPSPVREILQFDKIIPRVCHSYCCLLQSELYVLMSHCHRSFKRRSHARALELKTLLPTLEDLYISNSDKFTWKTTESVLLTPLERELKVDTSSHAHQELVSLHWILSSARNTLKQLYECTDTLPESSSFLDEINSFITILTERKVEIDGIIGDMECVEKCLELQDLHKSEIHLLIDMLRSESNYSEAECIFALSKLGHRKVDLESLLIHAFSHHRRHSSLHRGMGLSLDNEDMIMSSSPHHTLEFGNQATQGPFTYSTSTQNTPIKSSSNNPLYLVLQSVFPSNQLAKS